MTCVGACEAAVQCKRVDAAPAELPRQCGDVSLSFAEHEAAPTGGDRVGDVGRDLSGAFGVLGQRSQHLLDWGLFAAVERELGLVDLEP
jgi:hypothetical protein